MTVLTPMRPERFEPLRLEEVSSDARDNVPALPTRRRYIDLRATASRS